MLDDIEEGFGLFARKEGYETRLSSTESRTKRQDRLHVEKEKSVSGKSFLRERAKRSTKVNISSESSIVLHVLFRLASLFRHLSFSISRPVFLNLRPNYFDPSSRSPLFIFFELCIPLSVFEFYHFFCYPSSRKSTLLKALYRFLEGCYGLSIYLQTLH